MLLVFMRSQLLLAFDLAVFMPLCLRVASLLLVEVQLCSLSALFPQLQDCRGEKPSAGEDGPVD